MNYWVIIHVTHNLLMLIMWVGHQKEIHILSNELEAVLNNEPRTSGVIFIMGAGGMGKTKVLRAMESMAAKRGFR